MSATPAPSATLRVARGQAEQQVAIDEWLQERASDGGQYAGLAVVAEGAFFDLGVPDGVALQRIATGCMCCVGLVPLQVTLQRLVRSVRPRAVLLLLADGAHLERLRALVATGKLGVSLEDSA